MKLIVTTDYRENYSDDINNPYWKEKFGSTYVFNNIQLGEACKPVDIEEMVAMCEINNPMAVETVSHWYVACDHEKLELENYELPGVIYYEKVDGTWTGYKVNDTRIADTWLREGIVVMEEFWKEVDGKREHYRQQFTMNDGSVLHSQEELSEWFSNVYTKQLVPEYIPV